MNLSTKKYIKILYDYNDEQQRNVDIYGEKLDSKWSQMCIKNKIRFTNEYNDLCVILGTHK